MSITIFHLLNAESGDSRGLPADSLSLSVHMKALGGQRDMSTNLVGLQAQLKLTGVESGLPR